MGELLMSNGDILFCKTFVVLRYTFVYVKWTTRPSTVVGYISRNGTERKRNASTGSECLHSYISKTISYTPL